jgi:Family of unknown function (DUF6541)
VTYLFVKNAHIYLARIARERQTKTRLAMYLLPVSLLIVLGTALCGLAWRGALPRSWDGAGHYGAAWIYCQEGFPDTFGWSQAYYGGMPLPNFYPPLFYWTISLLHHSGIASFDLAFKLVLILPLLLLPAALWLLAAKLSRQNRLVTVCATLLTLPLITNSSLGVIGLSYFGTFAGGLYTQPLGFCLLIAWYVCYSSADQNARRICLSALLLALCALANFFSALTAILLAAVAVTDELLNYVKARDGVARDRSRRRLLALIVAPLLAIGLTLFWLAPLIHSAEFFVTRPTSEPLSQLFLPTTLGFYGLAVFGAVIWWRRPTPPARPFLLGCLLLAAVTILSASVAPRWLPVQPARFLSTLMLLLTAPAGYALAAVWKTIVAMVREKRQSAELSTEERLDLPWLRHPVMVCLALILALVLALSTMVSFRLVTDGAFYRSDGSDPNYETIRGVLEFARQHSDGMYLVATADFHKELALDYAIDGRTLAALLGAQGNETLSTAFREASAHSLFTDPLIGAISDFTNNFGISATLGADLDFQEQPMAGHLERARLMGVKYVIVASSRTKDRLMREATFSNRMDFGVWTVFTLPRDPEPQVRPLVYRPALVVSDFSVKLRRSDEYDYVRFAEEQFTSGWFDVLLARSPERKIDRLQNLERFGALILDTYERHDEEQAYRKLRDYAQRHALIMLSSEDSLFRRIRAQINEFPGARIIERGPEPNGVWLNSDTPSLRLGASEIRRTWREIQKVLNETKVSVSAFSSSGDDGKGAAVSSVITRYQVRIDPGRTAPTELANGIPVLIGMTYHPNWRRQDGEEIYAATPFQTLTFVTGPATITYGRNAFDKAGLWGSIATLILLCGLAVIPFRRGGMGAAQPTKGPDSL